MKNVVERDYLFHSKGGLFTNHYDQGIWSNFILSLYSEQCVNNVIDSHKTTSWNRLYESPLFNLRSTQVMIMSNKKQCTMTIRTTVNILKRSITNKIVSHRSFKNRHWNKLIKNIHPDSPMFTNWWSSLWQMQNNSLTAVSTFFLRFQTF